MKKWLCIICGLIYDEAKGWPSDGIAPGTAWEDVPDDWLCPDCLVGKADFEMLEITDEEPAPLAVVAELSTPLTDAALEPVVIIGTGHGGYQLAAALRAQSPNLPITLFTADDGALYSKPALSNALALGKDGDSLVSEPALAWEQRLGVRVYPHTRVERIDRDNRQLHTNIGIYPYGRLVLATGASPIVIPVEGEQSTMLSVNDLADYRRFRQQLTGKRHVTILGDGLIGCEFANDLAAQGVAVTVVGLGQWPMERLIPQPLGQALQQALTELGTDWALQDSITRIDTEGEGYRLQLQSGRVLNTDLVLSAVGLRPNTGLAQAAGLVTGRGIRVDICHQTSDPHIFALGDCAEVEGQWAPYIAPINQAMPALVNSLLGTLTPAVLKPAPVLVKTPALPLSVMPASGEGEWRVEGSDQELAAGFYNPAGALAGFALLGSTQQGLRSQWLERLTSNRQAA
ncbi:pyridine nucleotide-disulfide oxidoreductase [Oceanisphaera marina]|uniref:Pyridine nucleotide-disulfide oxidoreductase n=2 Tax=Oceanisphaera marina TaxID=2017550 RepID=A0ABQ1IGE1_9GAMM|nr:pyridine nucleotide-disulfide oxidoreductase [Oceanisphaera marina]